VPAPNPLSLHPGRPNRAFKCPGTGVQPLPEHAARVDIRRRTVALDRMPDTAAIAFGIDHTEEFETAQALTGDRNRPL